jgi:hypothetical protein
MKKWSALDYNEAWRSCYYVFWRFRDVWQKVQPFLVEICKLRPYKATFVFSLLPSDCEARTGYCKWFQESVFSGFLDPGSVSFWRCVAHFTCINNKIKKTGAQKFLMLSKKCHCTIYTCDLMRNYAKRLIGPVYSSRNNFRKLYEIESIALLSKDGTYTYISWKQM